MNRVSVKGFYFLIILQCKYITAVKYFRSKKYSNTCTVNLASEMKAKIQTNSNNYCLHFVSCQFGFDILEYIPNCLVYCAVLNCVLI